MKQEGDNEFYQCLIYDTLPLCSWFVFDLYKYSEAAMRRAITTTWARFPTLKEHSLSPYQNPWVPDKLNRQLMDDVAPCGACRPWIFFINGVLCLLKMNGIGMEKEER
ncbi:hypothetical protein HKD37_19G053090 [Glycine soja]